MLNSVSTVLTAEDEKSAVNPGPGGWGVLLWIGRSRNSTMRVPPLLSASL